MAKNLFLDVSSAISKRSTILRHKAVCFYQWFDFSILKNPCNINLWNKQPSFFEALKGFSFKNLVFRDVLHIKDFLLFIKHKIGLIDFVWSTAFRKI